jgi:predicted branched-subunit amino acid permease
MPDTSYRRDGFALSAAVGVVGVTFGVFASASGLSLLQAMALSGLTFTGASQFAFVATIAAHGTVIAAALGALTLAMRNSLYGPALTDYLPARGWRRFVTAQFIIDETTAMTLAHPEQPRRSFWWTAIWLYSLWNIGTLLGHVGASQVGDPSAFGLDAAFPAALLAMLIPLLRSRRTILVAVAAVALAVAAVPFVPAGIPILLASLGILAGRGMSR